MELPHAECYRIKMVEPIHLGSRQQREQWLKEAHYNPYLLKSKHVYIDLLSDSGAGAMSTQQWAESMIGDESYGGASSFYNLEDSVRRIFGLDYVLPVHQGRGAENVLFTLLIKDGDVVPGNGHFITTKGHIENRKGQVANCCIEEVFNTDVTEVYHPFKGNIDLVKLERVITDNPKGTVPFVLLTITSSSGGGQPVSMENIKEARKVASKHGILLCFDACRFAENAYFIKKREPGYSDKTIKEIVKEMMSHADAVIMSGKKDGYSNIGGFLAFRDEKLAEQAQPLGTLYEGHITYGGMAGRDMNALAQGLEEATQFDYVNTRIKQVEYLGDQLSKHGIPILKPIGGSGIFIDAGKILPQIQKEKFPSLVLLNELYLEAGIRGMEIGSLRAGRCPETKQNILAKTEYIRLGIPRRTYTNNHMDVVVVALTNVMARRDDVTNGYDILWEGPFMRHATAKLKPTTDNI